MTELGGSGSCDRDVCGISEERESSSVTTPFGGGLVLLYVKQRTCGRGRERERERRKVREMCEVWTCQTPLSR